MNVKRLLTIGFMLLLVLTACSAQSGDDANYYLEEPRAAQSEAAYDMDAEYEMADADDGAFGAGAPTSGANPVLAQNQIDRLIIRNGFMSIDVTDTEATIATIGALADTMGGWVVSSEISQFGERKSGNIVIRVEARQFEAALIEIRELAVTVNSESTSGQDVTEEFVDLSARLDNLEATAARVRTFLDEARNTEEALEVNRELSRLESEIEAIKGRLNYLSQSAAFSTINVSIFPDEAGEPIEVAGWRPEGVAKDAVEALVTTLQILANIVIWLGIYALPLLLLGLLPLYVIFRFVRRRMRREPAVAAEG